MIESELEYDSKFQKHKCKQRLTKLHQMIIRRRRLKLRQMEKLEPIRKKFEKRERNREGKALTAAQLELSIEKELLHRLKEGQYPKDIYNLDVKEFEKELEENGVAVEEQIEFDEDSDMGEPDRQIVEGDFAEDDDIENLGGDMGDIGEEDDSDDSEQQAGGKGGNGEKRQKLVEIEFEREEEVKEPEMVTN